MVREVPRLVSDSPCSSVLLSDGVLLLLTAGCRAAGTADTGNAGAGMSMLGVTWNRPTVTDAGWTSDLTADVFRFGTLTFISGTGGCS